MNDVRVQTPGARYCHFPLDRGYDEVYFNGLLSERKEYDQNGKEKWIKITLRNEPLDCRNYANAAMVVLNPDLDALNAARHDMKPRRKKPIRKPRTYHTDIYGKELL
jgi:phage terminase large subunit GpA-like protein